MYLIIFVQLSIELRRLRGSNHANGAQGGESIPWSRYNLIACGRLPAASQQR